MRRRILGSTLVATATLCGPAVRAETIDHGTAIVALGFIEGIRAVDLEPCPEEASGVQQVFNVSDTQSLEAMSPSELWMKVGSTLGQMGYQASPGQKEIYLGVVGEGEDLRHVTQRVRSTAGERTFDQVGLMTFKRDGAGWKAFPEDRLQRFAAEAGGEEDD